MRETASSFAISTAPTLVRLFTQGSSAVGGGGGTRLVPQVSDDRVVVRQLEHPRWAFAEELTSDRVADATEARPGRQHVVESAVRVQADSCQRIPV